MTVIAAIPTDDGVFMAADSQLTRGDSIICQTRKIIDKRAGTSDALIAVSGHAGLASLAQHALRLPDAPPVFDAVDCDAWAHAVAQALAELATEAKPPLLHEGRVDGEALLAIGPRLWLLNGASAVRMSEPFAIGSGAPEARGALAALAELGSHYDPTWRLQVAVRAAIGLDPNCGGEITSARTISIMPDQDHPGGDPLPGS